MNRQGALQPNGLSAVDESAEQTVIAELRAHIRSILYGADEPMELTMDDERRLETALFALIREMRRSRGEERGEV